MNKQNPSPQLATSEPIAIVGIDCMFPQAPDLETYWRNIKTSQDAIDDIPESHWKPDDYFDSDSSQPDMTYARRGGFLDSVAFNPLHFGIAPNAIEATDSSQLLALMVTERALADAGYAARANSTSGRRFDRSRTSVMLGVTGTLELVIPLGARLGHPRWRKAMLEAGIPAETTAEIIARIAAGYVPWQEQSFPGLLGNVTAGRIANRLDLGGANCVVDAACASSISAIHMAVMELSLGRCDMAISGGVDTFNDIFMYMCFSKTPALSASGDIRPFSDDADGTMLGEGIGVLVLKRLADAQRDGDRIHAIIKGIGASSDGAGNAIYAPSASGQARALRAAYREADVRPRSIELVEAHGTGTRVGDQVEVDALSAVYGEDAQGCDPQQSWCALGSVKSMIGHTKAAAGVAGIIKSALALQHKVLPPTIKVSRPLESLTPGLSPIYLNTSARPWIAQTAHPRRAAISAFGFGGSNFHCVLEEAQTSKQTPDWVGDLQIVAISGDRRDSLHKQLTAFQEAVLADLDLGWDEVRRRAKDSRDVFSSGAHCRLIFLLHRQQPVTPSFFVELHARIREVGSGPAVATTTEDSFYGEGPPGGRLGVVFPGQGSQHVNMLKELSCLFPCMLNRWQQVNMAVSEDECGDTLCISEQVYPIPAFDRDAVKAQRTALRATHIAQPALAAASLGALDVLQQFGLHAEAFAGHSFGEFIALYAAGVISDVALLRLAKHRGQCMGRACEQNRGAMLAVSAQLDIVESILEDHSLPLAIANHNSPRQVVLSGDAEAIDQAQEIFTAQNLTSIPLPVAGAFHSPLMRTARDEFETALAKTEFNSPAEQVYSNVSSACYPTDTTEIRELLGSQITAPVRFVEMIRCMYNDGVHSFLEVGPGKVLHTLIGAILQDQPHQVIALDAGSGHGSELHDLGKALAQLAAGGYEIDLQQWDPAPPQARPHEDFSIQISGANHFEPKQMPAMQYSLDTQHPQPAKENTISHIPATPGTDMDLIQTTLLALQKMQQETSDLHRQYLESQQSAQRSIELLIRQQLPAHGVTVVDLGSTAEPQRLIPDSVVAEPEASTTTTDVTPVAEPEPAAAIDSVRAELFNIVAEKTGYPRDVLAPEMSLDGDLGIDSIKRVEIFSALGEYFPSLASLSADEAGRLETLREIELRLAQGSDHSQQVTPTHGADLGGENLSNHIAANIIGVIADKTGYPVDALNPQMRLDEDLGIDSIKRVEILSSLQDQFPELPRLDADTAGSLQTIQDISNCLSGANPAAVSDTEALILPEGSTVLNDTGTRIRQVFANQTGYPAEMLDNSMQLDSDLGIDSIKRVEIFSTLQDIFPHAPIVEPDAMASLLSIGAIIDYLGGAATPANVADAVANTAAPCCARENLPRPRSSTSLSELPVGPGNLDLGLHRLVLKSTTHALAQRTALPLPDNAVIGIFTENSPLADALRQAFEKRGIFSVLIHPDRDQAVETLAGLLIISAENTSPQTLGNAFAVMRKYGPQLQHNASSGGTLLATVSRLNGQFGLGPGAIDQPISAGLGGMLKTAAQEWPQVHCKSIDIPPTHDNGQEVAESIVTEVLLNGPLEVGLGQRGPVTLELLPEALPTTQHRQRSLLGKGELVLISGGARGISAAIAIALARRYQPTLLLLGRSLQPDTEAQWLAGVVGESAIKGAIHKHHGGHLTPQEIQAQYRLIIGNREMLETLARIEASDAKVLYRSVDIRDRDAVALIAERVQAEHGPLRGIVHGAGILADSLIADKTDHQFEGVLSTKCDGFMNLLACLRDRNPAFIVACSSTTARFGRRGQADYAAANECLNKLAQDAARHHPGSKVLSVNWGPWDGGMVDARLKSVFHKEGVGLIPLEAGANYLLQELQCPPSPAVELIVMGPTPEQSPACAIRSTTEPVTPLLHCFNQEVSLASMPILAAHVINARAVVPVALIIEWLAHGALHQCPGLRFVGLEELRVFKGIILDADQNLDIQILAAAVPHLTAHQESREIITVEVRSGDLIHARANIHLCRTFPVAPNPQPACDHTPYLRQPYADSPLFHGAALQGITRIIGCDAQGINAEVNSAPAPTHWINEPLRTQWLADPLVLDASFQMMILWAEQMYSHGSLPTAIGRMDLYASFPGTSPDSSTDPTVSINALVHSHQAHSANASIDFRDRHGQLIAHIENYECVIDVSLNSGFARNTLTRHI